MFSSQTCIQSEHAARYLNTLCRHFARKVAASWNEQQGEVQFVDGLCKMWLDADVSLVICCETPSEQQLDKVESILTMHIQMFQRREELSINWLR